MKSRIKVTTIVGTRPELVRMAAILKKLDTFFVHRLVHTGQNSDVNLSEVFFNELGIRTPDNSLEIPSFSLGSFLSQLFLKMEKELDEFVPDAIVILGDTNSSLAGILAKRRGIPVYHLEAGNRSFDMNVPEEINRRIIDHFSDFNLAYTRQARDNLLREGMHPRNISIIGSPLQEIFDKNSYRIEESRVLESLGISPGNFFLVSAHRQENIDSPSRLALILEAINSIAEKYKVPVIVSTHPRMKQRIQEFGLPISNLVNFHEPFGFFDYSKLQKNSRLVISDSGSVSEESSILKFRAITIRDSIERPEAIETGSILMPGISKDSILEAIELLENGLTLGTSPEEYMIPDCSTRVVNFILSTCRQHKFWSGLRD